MRLTKSLCLFSINCILLTATSSCADTEYKELENGIALSSAYGRLTVTVPASGSIRVQCVPDGVELPELENLIYTEQLQPDCKVNITKNGYKVTLMPDKGNLDISGQNAGT